MPFLYARAYIVHCIFSQFLGETAPGSQAKGVKKSYPTRQRAAVMSNSSSGSKEDENGKARCRDGFT